MSVMERQVSMFAFKWLRIQMLLNAVKSSLAISHVRLHCIHSPGKLKILSNCGFIVAFACSAWLQPLTTGKCAV